MSRKLLFIVSLFVATVSFSFSQSDVSNSDFGNSTMEQEDDRLRVFPNPTSGQITISGNRGTGTLEVYNVLGARVLERRLSTEDTEMDISNLPSGVYMFRYTNDNGKSVVKKVIKR